MTRLIRNPKNLIAGLVFLLVGTGFALMSRSYSFGSLTQMGPGFFPLVLGVILALLGVVIAASAFQGEAVSFERFSLRPAGIVIVSIVLFGAMIRGAGLIPSIIVLVVGVSVAERSFNFVLAATLAVALALFSYFVFVRGLQLPMSAFGTWFGAW